MKIMIFHLIDGPGGANKIWGTDTNNLYFASDVGRLTRFNGTRWELIETNTTQDITDIWGSRNKKTGELEILAVTGSTPENMDRKIFKISGLTATAISDSGIGSRSNLQGIWFEAGRKYYTCGGSIYSKRNIYSTNPWLADYYTMYEEHYYGIRGNGIGDVVIAGTAGEIVHYNGKTWKNYVQLTRLGYGAYLGVAMKDNLIVALGENYGKGVIAIGSR
jgi:hypothetical protein